MKYEGFCEGVRKLIARTEPDTKVRFYNDTEKGRFFAYLSTGMTISMNVEGANLSFKYGSGHHMRVPTQRAFCVA